MVTTEKFRSTLSEQENQVVSTYLSKIEGLKAEYAAVNKDLIKKYGIAYTLPSITKEDRYRADKITLSLNVVRTELYNYETGLLKKYKLKRYS